MSALKKSPKKNAGPKLQLVPSATPRPVTEGLYELLFAEAGDAIILVQANSGKVLSANRRLEELTGYLASELATLGVAVLFPNTSAREGKQTMRSALFSAELLSHSGFYEDMALQKKDGYLAFATLSVKTLTAQQTGDEALVFCILHDVGVKKSMERDLLAKHWELKSAYEELEQAHMELKSAQEALVQAGKLAALGELAAGVAHELNQPLAGIHGFTQELESHLKKSGANAEALDFCNEVLKNSTRMRKIIQQLREFTRKSVEDFQEVALEEVIHESLHLLEQQFRSRGITVSVRAEAGVPRVYCNPFQLEQVFINLATNARDAIEGTGRGSGSLTISLRPKASAKKQFVEIQFQDDGAGMSSEAKNRAFEPFFTTKEVGKGTGLGLSVSYGIIAKIHGTMVIQSDPGRGTNFILTLPVDYRTLHAEQEKEG
jgi:PAS domain S-box-containing protein